MSALDRYRAYMSTCAAGGVLPCSYQAFAADEEHQVGREGGHLMQAQSSGTRMASGVTAGLALRAHGSTLVHIADKLRQAGAKLPITVTAETATPETLIARGLSIALCLVETEMENQAAASALLPTAAPAPAADVRRQQDATSASAQGDNRKLIVVGGRQFSAQALLDLQHDAARYRWLRDKADSMLGVAAPMVASLDETGRVTTLLDGDELDVAVDMAMAAPAEKRQRKTKRVGTDK